MFNCKDLFRIRNLCILAMLIAMEVVLERLLAINTLIVKINLAFVPVALSAYLFGPVGGMLCYGIGDVVGSLLFPAGAFNPLFTLTCVIVGLMYGVILQGTTKWWKIAIASFLARTIGTLVLNALWISVFFSPKGYTAIMLARIPEAAIMFAAEIIILIPLFCGGGNWLRHLRKNSR